MTAGMVAHIWCNGSDERGPCAAVITNAAVRTLAQARREAAKAGWLCAAGRKGIWEHTDYCPDHKPQEGT